MAKLSFSERWILANQYRILEMLDPDRAEFHRRAVTILENGFEDEYREAAQYNVESPSIAPEVSEEVKDILQMFREMQWVREKIDDPAILESPLLEFWGFDGNNTHDHLFYASFLLELGQFRELGNRPTWDSHSDTIETYRSMVRAWKALPRHGLRMTKEDVQAILDAPRLENQPLPENVVPFQA